MGHVLIPPLPQGRHTRDVLKILDQGAGANQAAQMLLRLIPKTLSQAKNDRGLFHTVRLLTDLPFLAHQSDVRRAFGSAGWLLPSRFRIPAFLSSFTSTIDQKVANSLSRTDLGELAQLAGVESLAGYLAHEIDLFQPDETSLIDQLTRLKKPTLWSDLLQDFWARLLFRILSILIHQAFLELNGPQQRFRSRFEQRRTLEHLEQYSRSATQTLKLYSSRWLDKHWIEPQVCVPDLEVQGYANYGLQKIINRTESLEEQASAA